ncbi:HNH endonuclease signature motif containing protein [uncultured Sphingomonas sp.]|uniref:HNH endonuclease n=1 Tax=uncultured Sphingomonas sp. TaxID=158754 RepID=UPI00344F5857
MPDLPRTYSRRPTPASRQGGSKALRDRTAAYKRLCASILHDHPLCVYCASTGAVTPATLVDHILALSLGGGNERTNLTASCTSCNADKAKAEARCAARGYGEQEARLDYDLAGWITRARPRTF